MQFSKWKGTMTDRERFNKQMHFKPVDRSFNMEFGYWDENFQQWPLFVDNGIKNNWEADHFFAFDKMRMVGRNVWMSPAYTQEVLEETDTTQIVLNPDGVLMELPRDGHSTIPHFLKSSIEKPADWERCKAERFRLDDPDRRIDVEMVKEQHPPTRDYPVGVNCGSMIGKIRDMLTLEGLTFAVYDYPDMVEDMVETCCLLVEDGLDAILPHIDVDFAFGWEDVSCNAGPLVSMDFFSHVIVPRYKRIGDKLKAAGVDIWYTDCDGDVRPFIPGFLEAGINCLFPFEVNGSGHPADIFSEYGREVRIIGGFDKMEMIKGRKAIKDYMESLVPLVEQGGFIPFCDHRCPPDVTPENYLYYLDLKERMFGMKS
ncbi:MAG: hypothetical protein GY866_43715 [Proteobacteria bacterium]|nr:hypothetical protein [Pseudomonadota bacterium]